MHCDFVMYRYINHEIKFYTSINKYFDYEDC